MDAYDKRPLYLRMYHDQVYVDLARLIGCHGVRRAIERGHTGRLSHGGMALACDRLFAGRMEPLRGRDADGAWCRSHGATRRRSGATPAQTPRRSRGSECQRVGLWRGSRRRSRRGLPHRMALRVAFGSHPNGRSPIASRPPADRRCGRSPGERLALLDRMPLLTPARGRDLSTSDPTLSLSHRNRRTPNLSRRQVARPHFFQKQAGISPQSPLLIQTVFVDSFVGGLQWPDSWLHSATTLGTGFEKGPVNADSGSGKCR